MSDEELFKRLKILRKFGLFNLPVSGGLRNVVNGSAK